MSFTHTLRRRAAHFNSSLEDEPAQWPPSNSGRLSSSASQSPYEPVVISGTDRVCANVRKAGSAPHHLWFASDQVATGLSTTGAQPSNARIFESPEFKSSLMSAGYTEMIDVSRKKIKARFTHAYSKAEFPTHLKAFLAEADLEPAGDFMVRMIGSTDVHSPYIHLFTKTMLSDTATRKIEPGLDSTGKTTWTHLHTTGTSSHWSCRRTKFWPIRVVFEGPSTIASVSSTVPADRDAAARRALERNTKSNAAYVNHPKRAVIEPEAQPHQRSSARTPSGDGERVERPRTPTILESVKQLGTAIVESIPPNVSETIHNRYVALKDWTKGGASESRLSSEDHLPSPDERGDRRRQRRAVKELPAEDERDRQLRAAAAEARRKKAEQRGMSKRASGSRYR